MKTLTIHCSNNYNIYLDKNLLESTLLRDYCIRVNKRIVIITDTHLENLYGTKLQNILKKQGITTDLLTFPAGESYKTRETKQTLEDTLLKKQYGRDTCLIALGGGVVTDLVGFIAATYCRGIPVIYIPTTLLAMVDASLGGKTAVNTPYGKNLIGTITQPQAVFIDPTVLNTLPHSEWYNAMAEVIKHSVIADASMFSALQQNVDKIKNDTDFLINMIYKSCLIKKNIIEQDEKEQGIRHLLNFGHTIAHAIETLEEYRIGHGEAVAIGMLVECHLAMRQGYLQEHDLLELKNLLQSYDLPLQTCAFQNPYTFKKTLSLDKKSKNNIPHFVLLEKIGQPLFHNQNYIMPVDSTILDSSLAWAAEHFSRKQE